jgi:flagellar biosynthesis protein FlhB
VSDEAPEKSSKTEDPSHKRLEDARKKGDVVKSQEVITWFSLLGSAALIAALGPFAVSGLSTPLTLLIANADTYDIAGPAFGTMMSGLFGSIVLFGVLPLVILAACAIAANLIQHQPLLSADPIMPKWSKVSPVSGFKRLFSAEALVNFAKGLFKIGVVAAALIYVLYPEQAQLETMIAADVAVMLPTLQGLALKLFYATLAVVTLVAAADYLFQRQKWWTEHKMTLQEVKEEYKQMEGDPHIKGRLKQIRLEKSKKRMMAQVPKATVVIANPTHFAVALKYDRSMAAPLCLAKGVDAVALRIRALAEENDVPVIENPPLARALYASVEVDHSIPAEHFKAVAQVIGFVMRLKTKSNWRAS